MQIEENDKVEQLIGIVENNLTNTVSHPASVQANFDDDDEFKKSSQTKSLLSQLEDMNNFMPPPASAAESPG